MLRLQNRVIANTYQNNNLKAKKAHNPQLKHSPVDSFKSTQTNDVNFKGFWGLFGKKGSKVVNQLEEHAGEQFSGYFDAAVARLNFIERCVKQEENMGVIQPLTNIETEYNCMVKPIHEIAGLKEKFAKLKVAATEADKVVDIYDRNCAIDYLRWTNSDGIRYVDKMLKGDFVKDPMIYAGSHHFCITNKGIIRAHYNKYYPIYTTFGRDFHAGGVTFLEDRCDFIQRGYDRVNQLIEIDNIDKLKVPIRRGDFSVEGFEPFRPKLTHDQQEIYNEMKKVKKQIDRLDAGYDRKKQNLLKQSANIKGNKTKKISKMEKDFAKTIESWQQQDRVQRTKQEAGLSYNFNFAEQDLEKFQDEYGIQLPPSIKF